MNAGAEGNVTGGPAVDVEALGFVPAARITVCRGEKQQYLRVLRYFDSTDVDREGGGAEERLNRRLPAQHLGKGRPYQRGLLAQRLPLRRVGGEGVERVANADNCGVESGREQRAHQQRGLLRRDLAGVDSASRAHWALIQGTTFAALDMTASKCALRGPKALKTMAP